MGVPNGTEVNGLQIRTLRKEKGLTLEELAKMSGVSRVAINRYELGDRVPNVTIAVKLAKALDCTVDDLLTDTAR